MKLIGDLKKQIEETKDIEEAKKILEKAGIELTDEELDLVTGGGIPRGGKVTIPRGGKVGVRV